MNGVMLLVLLCAANPASAPSLPPEIDESAFRTALRERGLIEWLDQHESDTPPADAADLTLRERERWLVKAGRQTDPAVRREQLLQAGALLESVIAQHPRDPRLLRWRLERSRDLLERREPEVFDRLLLYELPGTGREQARTLAAQAEQELVLLREGIARSWGSLEALDEASLARLRTSTSVRQLQEIDQQSLILLAWARLYRVLTEPDADRRRTDAGALLDEALTAGWIQVRPGQELRRGSALILAAISARTAERFEEADRFAREIVGLFKPSSPAAASLRQASLIAVLEQVRILRDSRKLSEALTAARQAGEWVQRTRASEPPALLAAALLECSVLARQQGPATAPAGDLKLTAGALAPLKTLVGKQPALRDDLYQLLAGVSMDVSKPDDVFLLQLWAGSVIHEAQRSGPRQADLQQRLSRVVKHLQPLFSAADSPSPAEGTTELVYLYGRALLLYGDFSGSMKAMSLIACKWPRDMRAEAATQMAVGIARDWLARAQETDRTAARDAFVESVRMWRDRSPDAPGVRRLQFFLAGQLDQAGKWEEAAGEYARVPKTDVNFVRAHVARARCLRMMVPAAATQPAASQAATDVPHLQEALATSREALEAALAADRQDACLTAEAAVGLARLTNDRRVNRPTEAVEVLDRAVQEVHLCPAVQSAAMRERLEGLRQLQRWDELVPVFTAYLRKEPEAARTAGGILLESMRRAVLLALDTGDEASVRRAAARAAELAESLVSTAGDPASTAPAEGDLAFNLTRAWLLVQAGQAQQALSLYDRLREQITEKSVPTGMTRCELGRAECLLALNRTSAAAPVYAEMLGRLPEHSPEWWEAFAGTLLCQQRLQADHAELVKAIQQQRRIAPDLGGPRWRRALERIERTPPVR